jgi:ADP-ribose pyrophosphatase
VAPPTDRLLGSRHAFRGRVISLRLDDVETPGGRRLVYEIVEHPGAVAIVPLLDDGRVLLVRQFRRAVAQDLLEVPAGTLEPGETPGECARRELAEEVGCAAARWECLASFYTAPGVMSEEMHVFLARDLSPAQAEHEEEDLRVETVPLAEARRRAIAGEIRDAKSIAGILLACERLGVSGPG